MPRVSGKIRFIIAVVFSLWSSAGFSQTAPTPSEAARYKGLHAAAWNNNIAQIRKLLADGVDPRSLDDAGRTPLHVAAFRSHDEAATALIRGGADPNALEHDKYDVITIAAGAPLDHVNNLGWTALIEAVVLGDGGPNHVATVRALVDGGADKSIRDRNGQTSLMLAESRGYQAMVEILD
jgi:ankyrin repeat protein